MGSFNRKNNLIQTYSLVLIDVACVLVSYVCSFYLRYRGTEHLRQTDLVICLGLTLFCVLYGVLLDWNHYIFRRGYFEELVAVIKYALSMTILLGFTVFILRQGEAFSRLVFGWYGIFNIVLTYIMHTLFKKFLSVYYKKSASSEKVMLVTYREYVGELLTDVRKDHEWSYEIMAIALMDATVDETEKDIDGIPIVANGAGIMDGLTSEVMDAAFLYLPGMGRDAVERIINYFETMGVKCYYSVGDFRHRGSMQSIGDFAGHLVITYENQATDYRRRAIKRVFDVIGSVIGLILTAVLTPFIALAIKLNSRGPVFFKQTRIGRNGRRFTMYKFRSMYTDAEERKSELLMDNEVDGLMFKMKDDPRITGVGKFLRKTSLDELPQFLNVLKGDMSLVGTRPPTEDEFERYSPHYRRRLSITPGLTGMWQVSGRSDIHSFDDVVALDLEYIDNWSLLLDLKILLQTIIVVFTGRGSK